MQTIANAYKCETDTGILLIHNGNTVQVDFPIDGNPRYFVLPDRAQSWSFNTFAGAMDYAERVLSHTNY